MSKIQQYKNWYLYEKDAHAKVLASIKSIPESNHDTKEFQDALDLFSHIIAARQFWLYRIDAIPEIPKNLFSPGAVFDGLKKRADEINELWDSYFGTLTDDEMERKFEYKTTGNKRVENSVEDILAQLHGHSWYHRGQIALLVRKLGGTPARTDYVFWTRKKLE